MKKIRLEKGNSHRNPIFSKKSSCQLDNFQTRNEGRTISPRVQNSSGKTIFQNMKAELSSIKQDFEKIIKKDASAKPQTPLTLNNSNKPKYCTSDRKDPRPASNYEKYDFVNGWKDQNQQVNGILQLQRNLPCHRETKPFNTNINEVNKNEKPKTAVFDEIDIKTQRSHRDEAKDSQIKRLEFKIVALEKDAEKYKGLHEKDAEELKILGKEKLSLISHVANQNQELASRNEHIDQLQKEKTSLVETIKTLHQQTSSNIHESVWLNEKNQLSQQIHELTFHNNELRTIHQQILAQNEQLKITNSNMQQYCDDVQRRCEAMEVDFRRKIQFIESDLEEYKKREDMYTNQISRLSQMTAHQATHQSHPTSSDDEIAALKIENDHLKRQVELEKQLHSSLSQKFEQKINDNNGVSEVVTKLEQKLSELVDQNGKLKTKLNYADSNVESLHEQNRSYIEQIRLYEERQKNEKRNRQLNPCEWEQMTEEIEQLKEENKKLREELEFKNFEKEMEGEKYQSPVNQELLQLTHDQINQIQMLRHTVKEEEIKNKNITSELFQLKNMNIRGQSGVNHQVQCLQQDIDKKVKLNKALKDVIFTVIVQKAGKREDEQELEHIIRQFSAIEAKLM